MPRTYDYWFWNVYVIFSHVFHGHCIIDRENVLWSIEGAIVHNFCWHVNTCESINSLSSSKKKKNISKRLSFAHSFDESNQ
jgi:hypothetical protein